MAQRILQVGIAGFGMSGRIFQAPFLNADPLFQIKKVYERTTCRAEAEYPYIQTVRSFEELLTEDIDLVVVSTPNELHFPMAKAAILAGKHVLVEKPVADTSGEAQILCDLAQEKGVVLAVYQNRRLDGDFVTLRQLIENGTLGEVLDYEAHFDRFVTGKSSKQWKRLGGITASVLYDLGVHLVDQAYALFGKPDAVYADLRKQRPETSCCDNFEIVLYYGNCKATLRAGEVVAMPGPHYTVHGRKGSFIKYGMDVQEKALVAGKRPPLEDWGVDDPAMYGTLAVVTGDGIHQEKVTTVIGNYGAFHRNLHSAITEGAPLLVDPRDTVEVLKILEAAIESNKTGKKISL